MTETKNNPINILDFVTMEQRNFMVTLSNHTDAMNHVRHVQGLYEAVLVYQELDDKDFAIFQFLVFTHYQLLYAISAVMRCHLAEAFTATRSAIDAAFNAALIIKDRSATEAYLNRTMPFDKLVRHYKNLIKDNKDLPHRFIPYLVEQYDKLSSFAHADISSFLHRTAIHKNDDRTSFSIEYFQYASDKNQFQIYILTILHSFLSVLDVFSDFLIHEKKIVPQNWQEELWRLGKTIYWEAEDLKKDLPIVEKV